MGTMATKQKRIHLISGYIKSVDVDLPYELLSVILMFYPYPAINFDGNVFNLTEEEKELITKWFMRTFDLEETDNCRFTSKLLYDYNKDGKDGVHFHQKCDSNINTFSIVETKFNGHLFGCFYSLSLGSKLSSHADNAAFLCVIRSCFKDKGPKIYRMRDDPLSIKNAYNNHSGCGPTFGRGFDLSIMDVYEKCNYCNHSAPTFKNVSGNELCGGVEYDKEDKRHIFEINKMMTFSIQYKID